MKELTVHGKYATGPTVVDDADARTIEALGVRLNAKPNGYVYFWVKKDGGGHKNIYLHRFLTGATKGQDVDHFDGDKLNNTRDNLRLCNRSQNMANLKRGGKGVYFVGGKWHARAMKDYKNLWIGSFDTREDAIEAYNRTVRELWDEFSKETW